MSPAAPETLHVLRRAVADITPLWRGEDCVIGFGIPSLDDALAGGLACGALHEIVPAAPLQSGAVAGFGLAIAALALATLALGGHRQGVWIQPDFVAVENGFPYGPGLDAMGLPMGRIVVLRVPRAPDALWAMEESLKCRAARVVVAELAGSDADLTATRRLALAAREGGGLGLLLHRSAGGMASAAMTRWEVASAPGERDRFGGLGPMTFALSLVKNRRGPTGQWHLSWDPHERVFFAAALSQPVAPAARDRQALTRRAG